MNCDGNHDGFGWESRLGAAWAQQRTNCGSSWASRHHRILEEALGRLEGCDPLQIPMSSGNGNRKYRRKVESATAAADIVDHFFLDTVGSGDK